MCSDFYETHRYLTPYACISYTEFLPLRKNGQKFLYACKYGFHDLHQSHNYSRNFLDISCTEFQQNLTSVENRGKFLSRPNGNLLSQHQLSLNWQLVKGLHGDIVCRFISPSSTKNIKNASKLIMPLGKARLCCVNFHEAHRSSWPVLNFTQIDQKIWEERVDIPLHP